MFHHQPTEKNKNFPFRPKITEYQNDDIDEFINYSQSAKNVLFYKFSNNQIQTKNDDTICNKYCNIMLELLNDSLTNIKCINEVIKDDCYLFLLGMLNNLNEKVKKIYNLYYNNNKIFLLLLFIIIKIIGNSCDLHDFSNNGKNSSKRC